MNPEPAPQLTHLRALAGELHARGLRAELRGTATASPYLTATSQGSAALTERILCQQAPDQAWQFCWPWQQPIGPASDPPASGLPAAGPVHHLAREHCPDPHVAYVDHDPVVVAHARALLADSPHITAAEADLRYPRHLLTMPEIRDVIDLSQPVAVLLVAVLHFVPDDADPHGIVQAITARLAPGSYIALSHVTADHLTPGAAQAAAAAYDGASAPGVPRTRDDIERFLDGLQIIPPGITDITAWRPGRGHGLRTARPPLFYGGIGRIPPR